MACRKRHSLFEHHTPLNKKKATQDSRDNELNNTPVRKCHGISPDQGRIFVLGQGDTGQLGLGPDVLERIRPTPLRLENELATLKGDTFIQVCAGGMHSVCLNSLGQVLTFGCNDEGALGRVTSGSNLAEDSETRPGFVVFSPGTYIVYVSAGDSHSAALDKNGSIWAWGTFRGASGPIGLTKPDEIAFEPVLIKLPGRAKQLASGADHLVCLVEGGRVFTLGCGEQGQLGRLAERFASNGGRKGIDALLHPAECRVRRNIFFDHIWAGGYATFARCALTGAIYACGLNNYSQLGLNVTHSDSLLHEISIHQGIKSDQQCSTNMHYMLWPANALNGYQSAIEDGSSVVSPKPLVHNWVQIAIGQHHTMALNDKGHVYAFGRADYGRLGLGSATEGVDEINFPTRIDSILADIFCKQIACGTACSFAVDKKGVGYSWGMGNNGQLGHKTDDDALVPEPIGGKHIENYSTIMISAGGQHTLILARCKDQHPPEENSRFTGVSE